MSSKFNMTTATVTDLVNTLGVQRTIANAIDSAKPKSLDELLAVRGMSQEIIDELDSSVEIIYYEDSRNDPLLKPESNPVLISQTHDHLPLAADSTERMLRHLLDRQDEASRRQEEASRQQEEWRRYVDQRQNETNQVLLEMLGKLTGSVAEPPAGPPTVVNPVITEASCEEGKGTLGIGKNSSKKVRLGGELSDYVPDDNLAQRHTGNVRDEISLLSVITHNNVYDGSYKQLQVFKLYISTSIMHIYSFLKCYHSSFMLELIIVIHLYNDTQCYCTHKSVFVPFLSQ